MHVSGRFACSASPDAATPRSSWLIVFPMTMDFACACYKSLSSSQNHISCWYSASAKDRATHDNTRYNTRSLPQSMTPPLNFSRSSEYDFLLPSSPAHSTSTKHSIYRDEDSKYRRRYSATLRYWRTLLDLFQSWLIEFMDFLLSSDMATQMSYRVLIRT